MNAPLRRVALACMALFGLLLVNVNYVQVVKAGDYRDDPRNARVLLRTYEQQRGAIALGTGSGRQALARSVETDDRLKYLRTYPGGPVYAHATGFFSLVYGNTGIERAEGRILSGEGDELFTRRLSDYVTGREPKGGSVVLTLQQKAQQAAYDALAGKRGAAVALDPKTGAILALVSRPSFDPASLSSHDPAKIRAAYKRLTDDGDQPLLNRALSQTYPPGSTFKVVTSAAALSEGTVDGPETVIPAPKELLLPQTSRPLRNFGGETCDPSGRQPLIDALAISCNTAYAQLGIDVGESALRKQAEAFGFGAGDLEVPLATATSAFPDEVNAPQLGQSAIGQYDVRATPLQMAMVAAGVANGGEVMRPYLVREVQAPDLSRLDVADPDVLHRAVSGDIAKQLTEMMEAVVERGTGGNAKIPGVRVAGKTGTAQNASGKAPHAWFIGFAPAEDPQVAVAVIVENGGSAGSEATGGAVAAPIAKAVMQAVLGR
ncbi:MAG: cell elongation-specific peptidoglycan D,D-transpeptidase [Frankiales bacterium]|nr:cell elongation-specific peptidoglycan D,D-transpeptidase [Frankiales bacterium]